MESQLLKADIDSQDALGFTALHHAAESGHLSMVDLLLERRASPLVFSSNRSLPLHLALASEATSAAYRLLESAPASSSQSGGAAGSMAIHSAAGQGDVALFGHLLQMRADLQSKQDDGSTPLHLAVQNGHTEVVAFILQQERERISRLVTARDERGLQPVHEAARGSLLPILSELLSARAEANAKDDEGHSVLYWATYGGHRPVLEGLLQARAEIEIPEPEAEGSKRGEAMANYLAAALVGPKPSRPRSPEFFLSSPSESGLRFWERSATTDGRAEPDACCRCCRSHKHGPLLAGDACEPSVTYRGCLIFKAAAAALGRSRR